MYIRSNLINQMSSKKKIIILINTVTPYQIDFFESLRQKVNLKVIFYNKNYKNYKFNFKKRNYQIFLNPAKNSLQDILTEIKKFKPNLIIFGGYRLKYSSKIITYLKESNINFYYWLENLNKKNYFKYKLVNFLIRKKIKLSNGVLSVGKIAQKLYSKNFKNVINLPYSIKIINDKKKSYFKNGKINFLFVGQLIERKGLHLMLDAFDKLSQDEKKKIQLHIVGEGNLKKKLKRFQIKNNFIKYYGFLFGKALDKIYKKSDVLVFPSIFDGWGVVPMEAMSKSLSLIISKDAGVSEILKGNKNGFTILPNTKELYLTIKKCIKNPTLIKNQGLRNQKLISGSICNSDISSNYLTKKISKVI